MLSGFASSATDTCRDTRRRKYEADIHLCRRPLSSGNPPSQFQYRFDLTDAGDTTGYITPLLFERASGELFTNYVVRGIGKGFTVSLDSIPTAIRFDIVEGPKVTDNGHYTFGFVNALVDWNGNQ